MKKLTFMNIKEEDILDREEMRNIMAGSGGSGGCNTTSDCGLCETCDATAGKCVPSGNCG
jgi:hypothetical protein